MLLENKYWWKIGAFKGESKGLMVRSRGFWKCTLLRSLLLLDGSNQTCRKPNVYPCWMVLEGVLEMNVDAFQSIKGIKGKRAPMPRCWKRKEMKGLTIVSESEMWVCG
jgi:hypothetical protein